MTLLTLRIVLVVVAGQTVMSFAILKLLRKLDHSADRIIQSLDELHDMIKPVVSELRQPELDGKH